MKKNYCTQNNGTCVTCSLTNYGLDCQNNPIATPKPTKRLRGYAATMASYTGHHGPVTIAAVEAQISQVLRDRLTGHEYGLAMSAVNAAYHDGRSAAGAELIDDDAVAVDGRLYPLGLLRKLTWDNPRITTWEPTTTSSQRGGDNDKYYLKDGEYIRCGNRYEAEARQGEGKQLYYRNDKTITVVSYDGHLIDTIDYMV